MFEQKEPESMKLKFIEDNLNFAKLKGSEFFEQSADEQKPNSLWICCSDSRVSPELITQSDIGEIFVLRNVANQFRLKDLGSLSALEYAVNKLNVRHIFVCGHYGCGGVNHIIDPVYYADSNKEYTPRTHIDKWLSNFIDDVYVPNRPEFSKIFDDILKDYKDSTVDERRDMYIQKKKDLLLELNVKKQVSNISKTDVVKNAWKDGIEIVIHGLMYDLKTGKLKDLDCDHDINYLKRPWFTFKWTQMMNRTVAYIIVFTYMYIMYKVIHVEVWDREFRITVRVPTIGELLYGNNNTGTEHEEAIIYQHCSKMVQHICGINSS